MVLIFLINSVRSFRCSDQGRSKIIMSLKSPTHIVLYHVHTHTHKKKTFCVVVIENYRKFCIFIVVVSIGNFGALDDSFFVQWGIFFMLLSSFVWRKYGNILWGELSFCRASVFCNWKVKAFGSGKGQSIYRAQNK